MSLGLVDLVLKEVLVLFESSGASLPVLDLLIQLLFLVVHLHSFFVQAINFLIQLVDHLILQSVVAILGVELLDQCLQLSFLGLHID